MTILRPWIRRIRAVNPSWYMILYSTLQYSCIIDIMRTSMRKYDANGWEILSARKYDAKLWETEIISSTRMNEIVQNQAENYIAPCSWSSTMFWIDWFCGLRQLQTNNCESWYARRVLQNDYSCTVSARTLWIPTGTLQTLDSGLWIPNIRIQL